MNRVHVIETLEALRALADPLRHRIMEAIQKEPLTVAQVAHLLNQKPNNLHYHMAELEKNGLVEVAETRRKGNLLEKTYQPVASVFRVAPDLFERSSGPEALEALYQQVISAQDITAVDLKAAILTGAFTSKEAGASLRMLLRWRLAPEQASAFVERLKALVKEFGPSAQPQEQTQPCALNLFFYTLAPETQSSGDDTHSAASLDGE